MKLVIFVLCLAPFASARFSAMSWCNNNGAYTDPLLFTQQVAPLNIERAILIGLDSPVEREQQYACVKLSIEYRDNQTHLNLFVMGQDNSSATYAAKVTTRNSNSYLMIEEYEGIDTLSEVSPFEQGVLNADAWGNVRLYVAYWSGNEIVLRTCDNMFFGASHAAYVFSTQPEGLAEVLGSECTAEAIKTLPYMDDFQVQMLPTETVLSCSESD